MISIPTDDSARRQSVSLRAVWLFLLLLATLAMAGCSNDPPESSLKVATHTVYNSGTMATLTGKLALDAGGCFMLQQPAGLQNMYLAFPRKFVSTTADTLTFAGHTYHVGDELAVGGGGSADKTDGLVVPKGCPAHGWTFVSPPG